MQAIKEPILNTIRKARRAMDAGGLSAAVREVETLHEARKKILAETAGKLSAGLIGGFTALIQPDDRDFRARYPRWKQALLNLCRARIAQAEARLGVILDEARKRYAAYGCADDVEDDLIVRRARARVAGLRERLKCIEAGRPAEDVWQQNVGALLADG